MRTWWNRWVALAATVGALTGGVGCGGPAAAPARSVAAEHSGGGEASAAPFGDEAGYLAARRRFVQMPTNAPERAALQRRLAGHVAQRCEEAEGFDALSECFEEAAWLLDPVDFTRGKLPEGVLRLAERLLPVASRRGAEAEALSALRVLKQGGDARGAQAERRYGRVGRWGEQVRATLDPVERWERLAGVWDRHARLVPAEDVLRRAAEIHWKEGRALLGALSGRERFYAMAQEFMRRRHMLPSEALRRVPLEAVAPMLARGQLAMAAEQLGRAPDGLPQVAQLRSVLQAADGDGAAAARAIEQLANVYLEAMPEVAWGLCREGLRRRLEPARFAACLGRVESEWGRGQQAVAWFAEALAAAPEQPGLYDEALRQLARFLDDAVGRSGEEEEALRLAERAEHWLAERRRRWPAQRPPIEQADLDLTVARLAARLGRVEQAEQRLARALERRPGDPEALAERGTLLLRLGRFEAALKTLRAALDAVPLRAEERAARRAELLERLGDAHRLAGNDTQAQRHYQQALRAWKRAVVRRRGGPLALALVHVGVLHDRLGEPERAEESFRKAVRAAPDWLEVHASILAHLVVSPTPRPELAADLFRRAGKQVDLDPDWRAYLGLWVWAVHVRGGSLDGTEQAAWRRALRELAEGEGWPAALASVATAALSPGALEQRADGRGERAEAAFYGAVARLAEGQREAAFEALRRVLATRMVGFYEYAMAQEWLWLAR